MSEAETTVATPDEPKVETVTTAEPERVLTIVVQGGTIKILPSPFTEAERLAVIARVFGALAH